MSISPVGNAPVGWYAGGSPSSSTSTSTTWCWSQTAAPSTGGTCCSPLLPRPRRCGRGTSIPLLGDVLPASAPGKGSQPHSGGALSTPCTQAQALAVAKEENATATGTVLMFSHPGSLSWAHFWQQFLTEASPAVLLHWEPWAVVTSCATSWSFPPPISAVYTSSPMRPFLQLPTAKEIQANQKHLCITDRESRMKANAKSLL